MFRVDSCWLGPYGAPAIEFGSGHKKGKYPAILFLWLLTHNFVILSFKNHLISKSQSDSIVVRALFSGITTGGVREGTMLTHKQ